MKSRRDLTPGEEKLARSIFGVSVNYRNVRVIGGKLLKNVAITPFGSMYFPYSSYKADFVGPNMYAPIQPVSDAKWFVHEFVHVWQHYMGMSVILLAAKAHAKGNGVQSAVYGYTLAPNTDLLDYNIEQQGDIIADYYDWKLWNQHIPLPQPPALYEDVLSNFFENPAYPIDEKWIRRVRARIRAWER